jgi:hypothetical protein
MKRIQLCFCALWVVLEYSWCGFCFVGGWSKRDIKVRFGSPHNPPAVFRRHSITQASFLAISAAISILMKPYG